MAPFSLMRCAPPGCLRRVKTSELLMRTNARGSQREFKLEIRQAGRNLAWKASENIVATASFFSAAENQSQRRVLMGKSPALLEVFR